MIEPEKKYGEYLGSKLCFGVANGSEALVLSLGAIGLAVNLRVTR